MNSAQWTSGGCIIFWCQACNSTHLVGIKKPAGVLWEWNGSLDSPTFSPSIKVTGVVPITDEQIDIIKNGGTVKPTPLICHSFVRNGIVEYCGDSTHQFAGKSLPIGTIPSDYHVPPPDVN